MSEEYGLKFVVNGEDYDKIKKSLNEQIDDLQQKVEQLEKENKRLKEWKEDLLSENIELENIRKEAIEYIKEDMFGEPNELYGLVDGEHLLNILNKGNE